MKNCPYCDELIQNKAKKCKHCHEWLSEDFKPPNNDYIDKGVATGKAIGKGLLNILNKGYDKAKKINNERLKRRYKHLHEPTADNPLIIEIKRNEYVYFYDSFLNINNEKYEYNDIRNIRFKTKKHSINFMEAQREVELVIYFDSNDWNKSCEEKEFVSESAIIINLSYEKHGIFTRKKDGQKNIELREYIYQFLCKKTFKNRMLFYEKMISQLGFIWIDSVYLITNEGKILEATFTKNDSTNNKEVADLLNHLKKETAQSYERGAHAARWYSHDPYTIELISSIWGWGNTIINMSNNKDLYDEFFFPSLKKCGKMIPDQFHEILQYMHEKL